MVVSSSMLFPFQKILSRWPEKTLKCTCPYSHCNQGHMKDPYFPTTVFSYSRGTAKNIIKSTSVFCHTAWTVGASAFSMELSIVFSCYWTRIKSGFACSFLSTNNVCLFTRPDWRPSLTLLPASASYWAHVKSSSSREGHPAVLWSSEHQWRPELSLGKLEMTWAEDQKTWILELVLLAS